MAAGNGDASPRRTISAVTRPSKDRRWAPRCFQDDSPGHRGVAQKGPFYFLLLALGSTGVVFGDIGTSPLYVFSGIFVSTLGTQPHPDDLPGTFSVIFWLLTWVVCGKYVMVVMRVNHEGEGGTFALMQTVLSVFQRKTGSARQAQQLSSGMAALDSETEESSEESSHSDEDAEIDGQLRAPWITLMAMLGCSLIIGDGAITPVISVLSAISGFSDLMPHTWQQVLLGVVILIFLFAVQRQGSRVIGLVAGPVMVLWFLAIAALGIYNIAEHPAEARRVAAGFSPLGVYDFVARGRFAGVSAWKALAGCVLSVTGAEALYADMGHFGAGPISLAWFGIVYPSLVLQYLGQATAISADPSTVATSFYSGVPDTLRTPMTVLATISAVIASQAMITGIFSLLSQAYALQLVPRMLVMHTNPSERGQVYIPEVNWVLCLMCVILCVTFKTSDALAGAYGIAVTGTFVVTTVLLWNVLRRAWRWRFVPSVLLVLPMLVIDVLLFTSNMMKLLESGWVPVAITLVSILMMHSYNWGRRRERTLALRSAQAEGQHPEGPGTPAMPSNIETLPALRALLRSGQLPRNGPAAVFLTSYEWKVPKSLDTLVKTVHCLPRTIVILWLHMEPVPFINDSDRVHFEVLDAEVGLYRVSMHFGYCEPLTAERFAIHTTLARIAAQHVHQHPGLAPLLAKPESTPASNRALSTGGVTYILNRVHHAIEPGHSCWTRFRATLYSFLLINARRPIRTFGLEQYKTMEVAAVRFL